MKNTGMLIILLLMAVVTGLPAAARSDGVRLLSERNGELVVEVSFGDSAYKTDPPVPPAIDSPGRPPLHYIRFFVAVPGTRGFSARATAVQERPFNGPPPVPVAYESGEGRPAPPPAEVFPAGPVTTSGPYRYRQTTLFAVDCYPLQVDYGRERVTAWQKYRVRVQYPPLPDEALRGAPDPFLRGLVINDRIIPMPADTRGAGTRVQAAPDPHFSLSQNWVKIEIDRRGIYAITGNDLNELGYQIDQINPATMRLFSAGGINQSRSFQDANGTWHAGNWMEECAVLIRGAADGSFSLQDSLLFYAVGPRGWRDYYRSGDSDTLYFDHPYATSNVYFLTWGGSFGATTARMDTLAASPAGGPLYTSYPERLHFEKDIVKRFDFGGDGWLWIEENASRSELPPGERLFPVFQVTNLVASVPQTFRTRALAPYCGLACDDWEKDNPGQNANHNHHAIYKMNGVEITEMIWNESYPARYENGVPVTARGTFLQEGSNRHSVGVPRDLNGIDFMYFDHFDIFFERRLRATGGELAFSMKDTTGVRTMRVDALPSADGIWVFDVTDQFDPVFLDGFVLQAGQGGTRELGFSSQFAGQKKHFWVCAQSAISRPAVIRRRSTTDLRNITSAPNLLILYNGAFRSAAERLGNYRAARLPYYATPRVTTADIEDVYDNFSGGVRDPMAIRNYCKFLYEQFPGSGGSPQLGYLLLMGDANTDYRNYATSQPDYLPTYLNLDPSEGTREAYASDDYFVTMDSLDQIDGYSIPDIAVGRLPASSASEAQAVVDKIINYETSNDFGPWRNRVILVADDENSTNSNTDDIFILQSETLTNNYLPPYIDVFKIYLTEFPDRGGENKEDARNLFVEQWRKGAILVNYIGHGSSRQMADEKVFLESNVGLLDNGDRLPLMCAFSCTIGDFDNASAKSLAEKLLLKNDGGVIGCIAASQVTYIHTNFSLDFNMFDEIFPEEPGSAAPLGAALIAAKSRTLPNPNQFQVENNDKYNLMGDPALQPAIPRRWLSFIPGDIDTILAGHSKQIRGYIGNGASVPDTSFNGKVHLYVRESDDTTGYTRESDGFYIYYRYPAGVMYRGVADATRGQFSFDFHVPSYPNPGRFAYVMGYAYDLSGREDASATKSDVQLAYPPPGTPLPDPIDGPPRITLGFEGGLTKIKPGAVLRADVRDADGINILNTTNEGRHTLVLDQTTIPIDVSESFSFYDGGVDTSGYLRYAMNDISAGNHRVIYKVGDSFGQISLDTLQFTVVDPVATFAEAVFNYPNPFSTDTRFLFHLSQRAEIRLDIYTTSGKRIRSLQATRDGGEAWIYWDGRDAVLDRVANGVYLYVARVTFLGVDAPAVTIRGKVVKVE